jgi:hypothetical protein
MPVTTLAFTPSPYIPLQAVTSTPWRLAILLGELRNLVEGQVLFFKGIQGNFLNCGF